MQNNQKNPNYRKENTLSAKHTTERRKVENTTRLHTPPLSEMTSRHLSRLSKVQSTCIFNKYTCTSTHYYTTTTLHNSINLDTIYKNNNTYYIIVPFTYNAIFYISPPPGQNTFFIQKHVFKEHKRTFIAYDKTLLKHSIKLRKNNTYTII